MQRKNTLENAIEEVSFGKNKPVTHKVIYLEEGHKIDAKEGDILVIKGKKEFVVKANSGSITTLTYDNQERIIEGTRLLNNNTIYSFEHYSHYDIVKRNSSRFRNYSLVMMSAGLTPDNSV